MPTGDLVDSAWAWRCYNLTMACSHVFAFADTPGCRAAKSRASRRQPRSLRQCATPGDSSCGDGGDTCQQRHPAHPGRQGHRVVKVAIALVPGSLWHRPTFRPYRGFRVRNLGGQLTSSEGPPGRVCEQASAAADDPGWVKTRRGRQRRGIACPGPLEFEWPCEHLRLHLRSGGRSFYGSNRPPSFHAKTPSGRWATPCPKHAASQDFRKAARRRPKPDRLGAHEAFDLSLGPGQRLLHRLTLQMAHGHLRHQALRINLLGDLRR